MRLIYRNKFWTGLCYILSKAGSMGYGKLLARRLNLNEQTELIKRLYQEIVSLVAPYQVILFGSASRYEMTESSDLDVVVIVTNIEEIKSVQKSLNQLSRRIDWPVDCLVIDLNSFENKSKVGGVYFVIKEEGVQLPLTSGL